MKYAKVILVGLLAIIGFGYHNINADDNINNGIYYDNVSYTDNVVFNNVDGVNFDYSANLIRPGDYYELYFDVVNSTNYNIAITDCIYNYDDEYIKYELTYADGSVINIGDTIKKGESIRIKYKVLYKKYVVEDDYVFDTSFSILYEQVI